MSSVFFLICTCLIAVSTFSLAVLHPEKRTTVFLFGAALIATLGIVSGEYSEMEMWESLNLPVLTLILALVLFSELLNMTGLLQWLSQKVEDKYDNPAPVQLILLIVMYVFSMLVNNLAALLVMLPLIRRLGTTFHFDTKRFLTVIIIASNVGGASTNIGDFPNILISEHAKANPLDYIIYLGLPLVLFSIVFFFLFYRPDIKRISVEMQRPEYKAEIRLLKRLARSSDTRVRLADLFLWLICFVTMLVAIGLTTSIDKSLIAIGLAVLLLLILRMRDEIIRTLDLSVLVFFGALFVIVGGLRESGLFELVSDSMREYVEDPIYITLLLMYFAAMITALFSAGPTTAGLIPIAVSLEGVVPGNAIWWSLSLGVLAGSSATLIGATAGPIMASLYEKETNDTFSIAYFCRLGIPALFVFLVLGSLYMFLYIYILSPST